MIVVEERRPGWARKIAGIIVDWPHIERERQIVSAQAERARKQVEESERLAEAMGQHTQRPDPVDVARWLDETFRGSAGQLRRISSSGLSG